VLLLVDANQELNYILDTIKKVEQRIEGTGKKLLVLLNKVDLVETEDQLRNIEQSIRSVIKTEDEFLRISAKSGKNTDQLTNKLLEAANYSQIEENDIIVTNTRHYEALKKAHESLQRAREGLQNDLPTDLLAMDVRDVIHYLGEITGDISTDEILGNIFANFCIGK
jgi:tRNA modification GTPase